MDLFEKVSLADFMKEEAKALSAHADVGMVLVSVQIGMLLKTFTTEHILKAGMMSAYDPINPDVGNGAKGADTMLRAYGLLTVGAALGLRDLAARLNVNDTFDEVDLLVSWYRNRWPR